MSRRSSASWIIASRRSPVSSASCGALAAQRARRRRALRAVARRAPSARPRLRARRARRRAPRAGAASRPGRARRPRPRRRTPGRAGRRSRRSASSMSAAPSVIRAASREQLELVRSVSAAARARIAASRWRAAKTAIGGAGDHGDQRHGRSCPRTSPCQTGLISESRKAIDADEPDVARAGPGAPSRAPAAGTRCGRTSCSPVAMSTAARAASAASAPTSQGTVAPLHGQVYADR